MYKKKKMLIQWKRVKIMNKENKIISKDENSKNMNDYLENKVEIV